MDDLQKREQLLYEQALRLPPEKRAAFLERVADEDVALRRRLEVRLQAAAPPPEHTGDTTQTAPTKGSAFYSTAEENPGEVIGPYKLSKKLGEGGMGTVWLAEQTQPLRRAVALKVIRQGLDSGQVLARFQAERQALALMDHPNIAKVLDAGVTAAGRPYFVMELVEGIPLTGFCDAHSLSVRERLELFVPICQAVQHAHQKGVIHRDLKPSNVLVAQYDGRPVPKVIDFGVAKAAGQQLTERTLLTEVGSIIGTLEYMSPEQAELNQLDIDTRSDIYSLGVLLYELLTGSTPLTREEVRERPFDEILRRIREEEPPKPSTRLSQSTEHLSAISAQRRLAPAQLTRILRGDLDWVVMKALEKDRNRRYETANGLVMDILRYLRDEPVVARPPANAYRLRKLVGRHKVAFAAAGAVALSLLLGLAVSASLLLKEKQARRRADTSTRFLAEMFNGLDPAVAQGTNTTAMLRKVLDETGVRVGKDLRNDPELQADLWDVIAHVNLVLGVYDKAEVTQRAALAARQAAVGQEHPDVATELSLLGTILYSRGNLAAAEDLHRKALAMRHKFRGEEHAEVAESLNDLSLVLFDEGKVDEALKLQRQAIAMSRRVFGEDDPKVASSLNNLANMLIGSGNLAEAEKLQREELALSKKRLGETHPEIAISLNNLALLLVDEKKLPEAEEVALQALSLRRKILPPEHEDVAQSLDVLGRVLTEEGKFDEAEPLLKAALEMRRKVLGNENMDVALSLDHLTEVLERQGRPEELEALARESLAIREQNRRDDPWTFNARSKLGGLLLNEKKYTEAEPLLISGYEGIQQHQSLAPAGERPGLQRPLERLVQLYQALGQPDKAAQWQQRLEELQKTESSTPVNRNGGS